MILQTNVFSNARQTDDCVVSVVVYAKETVRVFLDAIVIAIVVFVVNKDENNAIADVTEESVVRFDLAEGKTANRTFSLFDSLFSFISLFSNSVRVQGNDTS